MSGGPSLNPQGCLSNLLSLTLTTWLILSLMVELTLHRGSLSLTLLLLPSQDVVYLINSWLTNSALVYEPKCGGRGGTPGLSQ
jgi:hypothetical protein